MADEFHLIRYINGAVGKATSNIQGGNTRGKRRDLFRSRYTLPKGAERLADSERARLNTLFSRYPEVKNVWEPREESGPWYRETDRDRAAERLRLLEAEIQSGSLLEFKQPIRMLGNWREEILNYFDYRVTNGSIEGKTNRIKTIKRTACGYANTHNFRMRILATDPGCGDRLSHLLTWNQ